MLSVTDNERDYEERRETGSKATKLSRRLSLKSAFSENAAPFRGQQPVAVAQCPIELSWDAGAVGAMSASPALMRQRQPTPRRVILVMKFIKDSRMKIQFYNLLSL